jgi:hypothetical protein
MKIFRAGAPWQRRGEASETWWRGTSRRLVNAFACVSGRRADRHHHVQPLPPVVLKAAQAEPRRASCGTHHLDDDRPADAVVGVESDEPIRTVEPGGAIPHGCNSSPTGRVPPAPSATRRPCKSHRPRTPRRRCGRQRRPRSGPRASGRSSLPAIGAADEARGGPACSSLLRDVEVVLRDVGLGERRFGKVRLAGIGERDAADRRRSLQAAARAAACVQVSLRPPSPSVCAGARYRRGRRFVHGFLPYDAARRLVGTQAGRQLAQRASPLHSVNDTSATSSAPPVPRASPRRIREQRVARSSERSLHTAARRSSNQVPTLPA